MQQFNIPYYKTFIMLANHINNISLKNQEIITHRLKIIEFFAEKIKKCKQDFCFYQPALTN